MASDNDSGYLLQEMDLSDSRHQTTNIQPAFSHHQYDSNKQQIIHIQEAYSGSKNIADPTAAHHRTLYYRTVRLTVLLGEWWFPEIASFAIAGALFGSHYYLLRVYDGEPVDKWDQSPLSPVFETLPSALSILSILMRGALGLPVASAIGQWKWHQYRRGPQPLDELDRFDKASRGITGSITFLLSGSFWSPASLGCGIIIASVFLVSILQNTIRTEIKSMQPYSGLEQAYIPVANKLASQNTLGSNLWEEELALLRATPYMQASIARGWSYRLSQEPGTNGTSSHVFPECPTNNCRWNTWQSLALKSACRETEDTKFNEAGRFSYSTAADITLMSGIDDDTTNTSLRMVTRDRVPSSSFYFNRSDTSAILAHVAVIMDFHRNGIGAETVECIFLWGVTQANSTWLNGTITDTLTSQNLTIDVSRPNRAPDVNNTRWKYDNITITTNGTCSIHTLDASLEELEPVPGDSCVFTVTDKAQRGLLNSLYPYISVSGRHRPTPAGRVVFRPTDAMSELFFWHWHQERGGAEEPTANGALFRTTKRQMTHVAYFVNSAMRVQSGTVSLGTAFEDAIFFQVRDRHLIIPGAIVALSVLFFGIAAVWTRGEHAWRNSQLPLLYHGLERTGPREWQTMRMTKMWEAACDASVQMETGGDGGLRLRRHTGKQEVRGRRGYTRIEETAR
ncbi:hypothetical protein F5X68DRAFT_275651 [Plectosphaerella plurivora]|uniref:Uncharacterized protein n=1 Tax=Plectosphaerella plurivora TaxID=936078 RepID=A0A9P8VDV5_9PEZI|nr:hypothetical protein F5X68DRAFT_275651 [Plectosphaerella plurivora]